MLPECVLGTACCSSCPTSRRSSAYSCRLQQWRAVCQMQRLRNPLDIATSIKTNIIIVISRGAACSVTACLRFS